MADTLKTVVKVLTCVEKVSSFASSIIPICGFISPLVGLLRKALQEDEAHALHKDFQELHCKMEDISANNQKCLDQILINEVNENYGKYEEYIKHQYEKFGDMVTKVRKDPDAADLHMKEFASVYERDKADESLDVYYRGVVGKGAVFGRNLLLVYLVNCKSNRTVMEQHCLYLRLLFHKGLITLMAYTAVTEDDVEQVAKKWANRVQEIQSKMEEVLSQCTDESPP